MSKLPDPVGKRFPTTSSLNHKSFAAQIHGAALDAKDQDGFLPLDMALGKAGGFGFSGAESVVREETATLLRQLMSAAGSAPSPAAPR